MFLKIVLYLVSWKISEKGSSSVFNILYLFSWLGSYGANHVELVL